jgi:serine/threonine protein kinase
MLSGRDTFSGEVVNVHGIPYSFERRLGSGGFGNIKLIVNMKFFFLSIRKIGSVYSAKSVDGRRVAIKVLNLRGLPPARSQNLVQTYLNEVSLLERLRQESRHVVVIHDFDFDPRSGQGRF